MRNEKELLGHGTTAQYERLTDPKNKVKGEFEENIAVLFDLLVDEVIELETEVDTDRPVWGRIRDEAADVANYAHMIILACDKRIKDGSL